MYRVCKAEGKAWLLKCYWVAKARLGGVIKIRRVFLDRGKFFREIALINELMKYAKCASAVEVIKYSGLYSNKLPLSSVVLSRNAIIISVGIR